MKKVLIETQLFKVNPVSLTEGKVSERGNPIVEGILATAEVKNGNGRYYSKDLWEREIDKYLQLVKENRAVGELDHPESSVINLKNVSHNITTRTDCFSVIILSLGLLNHMINYLTVFMLRTEHDYLRISIDLYIMPGWPVKHIIGVYSLLNAIHIGGGKLPAQNKAPVRTLA